MRPLLMTIGSFLLTLPNNPCYCDFRKSMVLPCSCGGRRDGHSIPQQISRACSVRMHLSRSTCGKVCAVLSHTIHHRQNRFVFANTRGSPGARTGHLSSPGTMDQAGTGTLAVGTRDGYAQFAIDTPGTHEEERRRDDQTRQSHVCRSKRHV